MEVPFSCDIWYSEDHGCAEYFMCPECIEQEIVEHDDASIAFSCHFCEHFSCGFVFWGTDSVDHWTDSGHPEKVHHDCHHGYDDERSRNLSKELWSYLYHFDCRSKLMKTADKDNNGNDEKSHTEPPIDRVKGSLNWGRNTQPSLLIMNSKRASIIEKHHSYDKKQNNRQH